MRYWDGKCRTLSTSLLGDACNESEPGWNQVVSDFVRQAPRERSAEVLARSCKLGELVGFEWAKDNNVRCIHSTGGNSLIALKAIASEKTEILGRLARLEAKARSMCAGLRPPQRR